MKICVSREDGADGGLDELLMGAEVYPLGGTHVALGLPFVAGVDEDDLSTVAYSEGDDIDSDDALDDLSTDVPEDDVVDSDATTEYIDSDYTEDCSTI